MSLSCIVCNSSMTCDNSKVDFLSHLEHKRIKNST